MLLEVLIQKGLTPCQAKVALIVAAGLSSKEAGERLFVSEKTVKFHITAIYKKLQVKSRTQFILWCAPFMSKEELNIGIKLTEIDFETKLPRGLSGNA